MATNYVQPGNHITVTNTDTTDSVDLSAGDGFRVGSLFGVCITDAAEGEDVVIATEGVWILPKVSAQAWALGDKIYWADATSNCTTTAGSNKLIGVAVAAAANPSSTGTVRLTGAFTI
ncbi:MAG: DUF2190 family protein [Mesorhizobium sp.]|uniref:DUF2190 family protein n=1 Tax=Mesorhizobium sp. TaxID=1871066 RepID=UPI000FE61175|nr:DUF2190 family protein [Mesorhizobium sp.]RWB26904.1 MAG: DUF2190 family protein [Mesorhizobium sp.]RWB63964.1 MAG: DUF2190 family protein [Mesorhizobium sp.]RWF52058.1 MAG: DUF2190 family protein [Mesorhizobium sp.]